MDEEINFEFVEHDPADYSPGAMSTGAFDWGDVLQGGITRAFDIASLYAQSRIVSTFPVMQTSQGVQPVAVAQMQARLNTMFLIGGAVLLLVLVRRG